MSASKWASVLVLSGLCILAAPVLAGEGMDQGSLLPQQQPQAVTVLGAPVVAPLVVAPLVVAPPVAPQPVQIQLAPVIPVQPAYPVLQIKPMAVSAPVVASQASAEPPPEHPAAR